MRQFHKGNLLPQIPCPNCGEEFKPYLKQGTRQKYCSDVCFRVVMRDVSAAKVKTLSSTDAAWLAGFIDGEGTISMYDNGNPKPVWRLSAVNTHLDSILHCIDLTGVGSTSLRHHQNPKWNDSLEWYVSTWQALEIVKQIEPYMITKKRTARQMIAALTED